MSLTLGISSQREIVIFKLVQSSAAPGLSVLQLMRRCYRLTNVVKATVRQSLCFPWAACDPHLITDSILHIFFSYNTPTFGSFPFLPQVFTTVPALDPSFLTRLSDVLFFLFLFFFFLICLSMQHYVMIQCTVQGCGCRQDRVIPGRCPP